jgi:hypothetical protein
MFDLEWERCAPWLQDALDAAGNWFALEDVKKVVLEGKAYFYPGMKAALVTEVRIYPRKRIYNCWLAGGDLEEIKKAFVPTIRMQAKKLQCDLITVQGRPGWKKVFNLKQRGVVLFEEVSL